MSAKSTMFSVLADKSAWIMLGDTTVSVLLERSETIVAKVREFPARCKIVHVQKWKIVKNQLLFLHSMHIRNTHWSRVNLSP